MHSNTHITSAAWEWQQATAIPDRRTAHQALIFRNQLYVIGGYTWDSKLDNWGYLHNDVQVATLGDDGQIVGGWTATEGFTGARSGHSCVIYKERLYVIGGGDNINYFNDVQIAPINADGTISKKAWTTSNNRLKKPRSVHRSVIFETQNGKAFLYVIGGAARRQSPTGEELPNADHLNTVEYAEINQDGSVGEWTSSPETLVNGRAAPGVFINDGYLYVAGGWGDDEVRYSDVQVSRLMEDGALSEWRKSEHSLCREQYGHSVFMLDEGAGATVFMLGGSAGEGHYLNDVQVAQIRQGSTSSWKLLLPQASLPVPCAMHASDYHKHYGILYVIGGSTLGMNLNDVRYVRLPLAK